MISNEPSHHQVIPVINGVRLKEVPLDMIVPYASQVFRNHGRTLKGMADRRGMTATEIVAAMEGRSITTSTEEELREAETILMKRIAQWKTHPECPLEDCKVCPEPTTTTFADNKVSTLFEAIAHGDDAHRAWLKSAIEAHFMDMPVPTYVEGRKKEYIVRHPGEPYFVLLGRDPQSPDLLDEWADRRAYCEPSDPKIEGARQVAKEMRSFKASNPYLGMDKALYEQSLTHFRPVMTRLVLLGWRLDWPVKSGAFTIGNARWCGADDWQFKDRQVAAGAKQVEVYGRIEHSPSSGPSPWPTIKAYL